MESINNYNFVSPEEIAVSGTVDDLAINSNYAHLIPNASTDAITGFQAPTADDHTSVFVAENDGTVNLTLKHLDAGSAVGNRLYLGGSDIVLAPQQYAFFRKVGKGFILTGIF